ncbi:hypothetical protein HPB50_018782 [Hyalomma asiaticum]|uniref:Uncharacterized protein n=1 Tax=Hyalomma asiaticum TaxID=266040 RepID=A0ACB7RIQ5_HYAAI|nr:hypothetical protein HPB50_018782 [Hyalomma asiaticum]
MASVPFASDPASRGSAETTKNRSTGDERQRREQNHDWWQQRRSRSGSSLGPTSAVQRPEPRLIPMGADTHVGIPTNASIGRRPDVLTEHRGRITHGGRRRGRAEPRAADASDEHSPTTASPPQQHERACDPRSRPAIFLQRGERNGSHTLQRCTEHRKKQG